MTYKYKIYIENIVDTGYKKIKVATVGGEYIPKKIIVFKVETSESLNELSKRLMSDGFIRNDDIFIKYMPSAIKAIMRQDKE